MTVYWYTLLDTVIALLFNTLPTVGRVLFRAVLNFVEILWTSKTQWEIHHRVWLHGKVPSAESDPTVRYRPQSLTPRQGTFRRVWPHVVMYLPQSLTPQGEIQCRVWLHGEAHTAESDFTVNYTLQSQSLTLLWDRHRCVSIEFDSN